MDNQRGQVGEGPAASTRAQRGLNPDLSASTQQGANHPVVPAEGLLEGHSRSLGFFSSAVKMTAPPGRSGWGKG